MKVAVRFARRWYFFLTVLLLLIYFGPHLWQGATSASPTPSQKSSGSEPKSGAPKIGMTFRRFTPAEPYNWRGAQTHALATSIWYPAEASAAEQPVQIPGLTIFVLWNAAQNANLPAQPAKFPLILLSHGTGGTAISIGWFAATLARRGYIVAGVNHPGNNAAETYTVEGFSEWWERARDLSVVLDNLLKDPTFGPRIDERRIGAAGFSLGGYTMIEIAGGITDPKMFMDFCASPKADAICKSPPEFPTLVEDFKKLMASNPEPFQHASDSYRDARVRAVFAMAPALGPAFRKESLEKISIPVEIVAGASDTNVPIASSAKYFAANIPHAKLHVFPGGASHYTFIETCTEQGRDRNPIVCGDAPGVNRDAIHAQTVDLAAEFFNAHFEVKLVWPAAADKEKIGAQ